MGFSFQVIYGNVPHRSPKTTQTTLIPEATKFHSAAFCLRYLETAIGRYESAVVCRIQRPQVHLGGGWGWGSSLAESSG